MAGLEEQ